MGLVFRHDPPRKAKRANPAGKFLMDLLTATGAPVLASTIYDRGAAQNFSPSQLKRTKKLLGVIAFKRKGEKVHSPWFWSLPQHVPDRHREGTRACWIYPSRARAKAVLPCSLREK
jgi:hypothetical protein